MKVVDPVDRAVVDQVVRAVDDQAGQAVGRRPEDHRLADLADN